MFRVFLSATALCALAACGGGGTSQGGQATLSAESGNLGPSNVAAAYSPQNGYSFAGNGENLSEIYRKPTWDLQNFSAYKDNDFTHFAFGRSTNNGLVGVTASNQHGSNNFAGATFAQGVTPNLPTAGTATYRGDYVGYRRTGNTVNNIVHGNVTMTADFANDRVSGVIDNRQLRSLRPYSNAGTTGSMTLNSTSISGNGQFTGSVSGGQGNGSYAGAFAGSDGQEVFGGIDVQNGGQRETGAIFAN